MADEGQEKVEPPGSLTDDNKKQIIDWLKERMGPSMRPCPMCGQQKWFLANTMVAPWEFSQGGVRLGKLNYPFVMLTCQQCGNTQFLNAVIMGILPSSEPPTESKE